MKLKNQLLLGVFITILLCTLSAGKYRKTIQLLKQ